MTKKELAQFIDDYLYEFKFIKELKEEGKKSKKYIYAEYYNNLYYLFYTLKNFEICDLMDKKAKEITTLYFKCDEKVDLYLENGIRDFESLANKITTYYNKLISI